MSYRRDTVHAFSRICCESIVKARAEGDPLVLTFGKVEPKPNTVNVVPGFTHFTLDCRHTDQAALLRLRRRSSRISSASAPRWASRPRSICGWTKRRSR